jgi:tryptophan-rich sensory protein
LLLMTGSIPAQAKLRYLLIMMAGSGLKFEEKKSSQTASIVRNQYYTNLKQVEHLPAPTIIPFVCLVLFYLINSMECVLSSLKLEAILHKSTRLQQWTRRPRFCNLLLYCAIFRSTFSHVRFQKSDCRLSFLCLIQTVGSTDFLYNL